MKIQQLTEKLKMVPDPRRQWGNRRHAPESILVIGFCTIVCGGEDFTDMETFGRERQEWLQGFLALPNGIPDSNTFRRVFERVDPQTLGEVLRDWLEQKADWTGLNAIGGVTSTVDENGKIRTYTRYFITSVTNIEEFAQAIREHWGIENQLHWCLDVAFREDASRARRDNSPLNLNVMRKNALSLLKSADWGRIGLRKKMFRAAMSSAALEYALTGIK